MIITGSEGLKPGALIRLIVYCCTFPFYQLTIANMNQIRPLISSSTLFICDVQERFRPLIYNMNTVIRRTELINNVCNILQIPIVISEQYPKAMGATVPEITRHINSYTFDKMKFSMINDDITSRLLAADRKQVIKSYDLNYH